MIKQNEIKVTINQDQKMYIIPANDGYSCLGFEVAYNRTQKMATWLRNHGEFPVVDEIELGTETAYQQYNLIRMQAYELCQERGIRCNIELVPELIGLEGKRVEVIDCDGEKRRFWVGKSTGWLPVHLEIAKINSAYGPAVMGTPFQSITIVRKDSRMFL